MNRKILPFLVLLLCAAGVARAQTRFDDDDRYMKLKKIASAGVPGTWNQYQAVGLGLGNASPCSSATAVVCTWTFLPTVAGSGIAIGVVTSNNVAVTLCTGTNTPVSGCTTPWTCGGTATVQTGTHKYDSAVGNVEVITITGNTGGCTSYTFAVSGAPGNSIWPGIVPNVIEFPPPSAGATVSVDQVSAIDDSTPCGTSGSPCTLAPFNSANSNALTGTDAVVQFNVPTYTNTSCVINSNISSGCAGTYSSPYNIDYNGDAIALNVPAGSLTGTALQSQEGTPNTGAVVFAAVAFKSNISSVFISQIWTQTNSDSFAYEGLTCSPTCSMPVPSTTGGDLLMICTQTEAATGATGYITSVSDNKTESWTDLASVRIGKTGYGTQDCQYVLSDTAGVTSITLTMNVSGALYFTGVYELNKSTGTAVLDAQASTDNSGTSTSTPAGQGLTLSGSDDACFELIEMPGATSGLLAVTSFLYPYDAWTNTNGQNYSTGNVAGAVGLGLNMPSVPAPTWMTYDGVAAGSLVSAVCFK